MLIVVLCLNPGSTDTLSSTMTKREIIIILRSLNIYSLITGIKIWRMNLTNIRDRFLNIYSQMIRTGYWHPGLDSVVQCSS
jgi:hypothetical protein